MKGPGFRLDLDVRRIWECPTCGRCRRRPGDVTQVDCDCQPDAPVAMRLVEKCHKTESPFDHVGFAAQKRIDAALRRPHDAPPEGASPQGPPLNDASADLAPSGEDASTPVAAEHSEPPPAGPDGELPPAENDRD